MSDLAASPGTQSQLFPNKTSGNEDFDKSRLYGSSAPVDSNNLEHLPRVSQLSLTMGMDHLLIAIPNSTPSARLIFLEDEHLVASRDEAQNSEAQQ